MKLKKDFITHNTPEGMLVVSVGGTFNGMLRSNSTAADIINMLAEDTDRESIIDAMLNKYNADRERIAADVDAVIEKLRSIGAIDG